MDLFAGTPFSRIYALALTNISDDIDLPKDNPPLLYRKLFMYLQNGLPRFNVPRGIESRLTFTEPVFDDCLIICDGTNSTYATGIVGMELAHASIGGESVRVGYDPDMGGVTFDEVYPAETAIDVDFYTDGYFNTRLNITEQTILGFCVALMWYNRFKNDGLSMTPKIQDGAFKIGSEHANINANTARYAEMLTELTNMMNDYAFLLAYKRTVPAVKHQFGGAWNG